MVTSDKEAVDVGIEAIEEDVTWLDRASVIYIIVLGGTKRVVVMVPVAVELAEGGTRIQQALPFPLVDSDCKGKVISLL